LSGEPKAFPFIKITNTKLVALLCHRHADADAYCSAYALSHLLKKMNRKLSIIAAAPGGFSALAKKVKEKFGMVVVDEPSFNDVDLFIVVDTGHIYLLAEWLDILKSKNAKKIFIDHHPLNPSIKQLADYYIIDESASSTSEIIYHIFEAKGYQITKKVAAAILTGIIFDSQHLKLADCETIRVVERLCERGALINESKKLLYTPRDFPETVARLKAAQRLQIYRAGRWIITTTVVGSYHASVARSLLDLGSDVAFAVGDDGEETKGSIRATQTFFRDTRLHLGKEVISKGASLMGGVGGGHPTAASFTAKGTPSKANNIVLKLLSEKLQTNIEKIS